MDITEVRATLLKIHAYFGGCYDNAADGSAAKAMFDNYMEAADQAERMLAESEAMGWISVKDRLPTYAELHDDEVLVLFEDGGVSSLGFDENMREDEYFGFWKQYYDERTLGATDSEWIAIPYVTHWMKKPEPPKENQE